MKFIMAATDGSEGAARAVAVAANLAKLINTKLLIVNVSEGELSDEERRLIDQLRIAEGDAFEEISRRILLKAKAVAHDQGAPDIATMSGAGDPAKVLLDIAASRHADAIVVGRRGRGQLEGLLLGSVSQKLSAQARYVVIIVP